MSALTYLSWLGRNPLIYELYKRQPTSSTRNTTPSFRKRATLHHHYSTSDNPESDSSSLSDNADTNSGQSTTYNTSRDFYDNDQDLQSEQDLPKEEQIALIHKRIKYIAEYAKSIANYNTTCP